MEQDLTQPSGIFQTILLAASVILAGLAPSNAQSFAQDLGISNLPYEDFIEGWGVGPAAAGSDSLYYAATSFTTGSGPGWILDSITVRLSGDDTNGPISKNGRFEIMGDNGGVPDSASPAIVGWDFSVSFGVGNDYNLPSTTGVTLAPNTTYWLVGGYEDVGYVYWQHTGDLQQDGLAGLGLPRRRC